MATPNFAAFASQYLNKQLESRTQGDSSVSSSSHPMFFSFTTDEEGSLHRGGHDMDLDDLDDPHLKESQDEESRPNARQQAQQLTDDEDPYLRLDEDEDHVIGPSTNIFVKQQGIPLLSRSHTNSQVASPPGSGWLAHLARSPSPAPSTSSTSISSELSPPPDFLIATPSPSKPTVSKSEGKSQGKPQGRPSSRPMPTSPTILPPPRAQPSLSLTESLLPRDGISRPIDVFTLPDPRHTSPRHRKHHDSIWISIFLGLVTLCVLFCILLLFTTNTPRNVPNAILPYTILLRTVPMMVILTFISAAVAYSHVYLLRIFVKPVMIATSVFVPATLFVCAVWAFVGSFMWDGDTVPTWGETVGLRIFSLVPLILSLLTARRLLHLPRQIHTTSSTLTLTTHLLIKNPYLLALSPAILVVMLIGSLPFVTLIFRLLLIGYPVGTGGKNGGGTLEWHVRAWADWAIVFVLGVWLWSWAVARGILRMTCASVIGSWYFAEPSAPLAAPHIHTLHAALMRSTGTSLGSITLASLILTLIRLLTLFILLLRRIPLLLLRIPRTPFPLPIPFLPYGISVSLSGMLVRAAMFIVPGVEWCIARAEGWSERMSGYALVYCGLTGVGFWEAAKRGGVLVRGLDSGNTNPDVGNVNNPEGRRTTRGGRPPPSRNPLLPTQHFKKIRLSSEPPLALLTISPLTLTFPFALGTYLFVAHTLGAPQEALVAALLAGAVTALVGLFCVGVVKDAADTLFLCYCIDKVAGERRRDEVFVAFEYDGTSSRPASRPLSSNRNRNINPNADLLEEGGNYMRAQQQQRIPQHKAGQKGRLQPETIIPRSPLSKGTDLLFDIGPDEDTESGSASDSGDGGQGGRAMPIPISRTQQQQYKHNKEKMNPTGYDVDLDSLDEGLEEDRTPTAGQAHSFGSRDRQQALQPAQPQQRLSKSPLRQQGQAPLQPTRQQPQSTTPQPVKPKPRVEEDEDDLDPFRRSIVLDEEEEELSEERNRNMNRLVQGQLATAQLQNIGQMPVRPGQEDRLPSNPRSPQQFQPRAPPPQRMLTSTQELNMKSQFLPSARSPSRFADSQISNSVDSYGGGRGGRGVEDEEGYDNSNAASTFQYGQGYVGDTGILSERLDESGKLDESERSEGDSELGPGSDFFK